MMRALLFLLALSTCCPSQQPFCAHQVESCSLDDSADLVGGDVDFQPTLSSKPTIQRNELSAQAVGNLNPTSYISIQNTPHEVLSSNRSSVGGGATYQRWLSDHFELGIAYEQNPSAGKLFWSGNYYRWPQMRYEALAFAAERLSSGKWALSIREGAGAILTNGYSNSGWSGDKAFLAGMSIDYALSKHIGLRTGLTVIASKLGCYRGIRCVASWATADDVSLGPVWKF